MPFPSDLDIARRATPKPLGDIAERMGIAPHVLEPHGDDVAKIRLEAIDELADRPLAKHVVVTAVTPTPLGEGKTTTVGLGGGHSQVETLNLHLTGDFHAVTDAHGLLSALVDDHLHHGNAFPGDHPSELRAIDEIAEAAGVRVATCAQFADGGRRATELAEAVMEATEEPSTFSLLYPDEATLREKIEIVATRVHGADGVDFSAIAARHLDTYERKGFGQLPVCVAKTHLSLSSDPALKGAAPTGWRMPVREVRASVGAGFVYPICGGIRTMPGLGPTPAAFRIDLDDAGEITGLS